MSFIFGPTRLLLPNLPTWMPTASNNTEIWIGQGNDNNRMVFYFGSQWRMVTTSNTGAWNGGAGAILPCLVIQGSTLYPIMRECGGYLYFTNGTKHVWFIEGTGWVYMNGGGPGYAPDSYTDTAGTVRGDAWWEITFPTSYSDDGTFTLEPQGTASDTLTGTFQWNRWDGPTTSSSPFGEYSAVSSSSSVSGTKVMGLPQWLDADGNKYIRSLEKDGSYYTYGTVHRSGTKWIIGTENSIDGWWEGSEPSTTASVVFKFCVPEGSEVTGEDITLTFDAYVEGNNVTDAYVGEVAIWH